MYLSKDFLETVKYCEVNIIRYSPVRTRFKFYFKQWYKLPLTISIEWNTIYGEPAMWSQPNEVAVRKQQLEEYFKIV